MCGISQAPWYDVLALGWVRRKVEGAGGKSPLCSSWWLQTEVGTRFTLTSVLVEWFLVMEPTALGVGMEVSPQHWGGVNDAVRVQWSGLPVHMDTKVPYWMGAMGHVRTVTPQGTVFVSLQGVGQRWEENLCSADFADGRAISPGLVGFSPRTSMRAWPTNTWF
jgi:hypothetical protein